jgi:hypothetical protein
MPFAVAGTSENGIHSTYSFLSHTTKLQLPSFPSSERSAALDYPEKYSKIKIRSRLWGRGIFQEFKVFLVMEKFYPRPSLCQTA